VSSPGPRAAERQRSSVLTNPHRPIRSPPTSGSCIPSRHPASRAPPAHAAIHAARYSDHAIPAFSTGTPSSTSPYPSAVTPASESPASPFAAAASQPRNESNGAAGVLRIIRYHDSHQPDASNPDHLAARSHPFNIQFDIRPLQPEQLTWSLPHRGRQRHQVRQISFLAILRHGWRGVGLDRRRTFPFLLCQLARTRQHRPANRSQDELEVVDLNVSSTARGSGGHGGRSAVLARTIRCRAGGRDALRVFRCRSPRA